MAAKRQKRDLFLDLNSPSMRSAASTLPDSLHTLPENLHDYDFVLLEFLKVLAKTQTLPKPSLQASSMSVDDVASALALDWAEDIDHGWMLSAESNAAASQSSLLSPLYGDVIQKLKTSNYFRGGRPESFTRTIIDILLQIGSITGRADWILGWGMKEDIENIKFVVEAKSEGLQKAALPQLLVYMSGVHDARELAGKTNSSVFGLATDSKDFEFVMLRPDRKLFMSRNLQWIWDQDTIINFFDHVLKSAIECSPTTTPVKEGNRSTAKEHFPKYLGRTFLSGGEEGGEEDDETEYNVIEVNGLSLLQRTDM